VGEFEAETDETVSTFIEQAAVRLDKSFYGQMYTQAVVYMAAHLMKLTANARDGISVVGPITSMKTGRLSVSSAGPIGGGDDALSTTTYGQELKAIKDSRPPQHPMLP